MKKLIPIPILLFLCCSFNSFAIKKKAVDSLYIICYKENLTIIFYTINQDKNLLRIGYFFDVKWIVHGFKKDSFFFTYEGPQRQGLNSWTIPQVDLKSIKNKDIYTLEEFTKKLTSKFLTDVFLEKFKIIMLYGTKIGSKFEVYPVKVGTDLSSEG